MKRKKKLVEITPKAEKVLTQQAKANKPPLKLKPYMEYLLEREAEKKVTT